MRDLSDNIILEKEQEKTRPIELYDIYLGSQTSVDDDTLFFAVCPERVSFWDIEDSPQLYLPIGISRSNIKHNMDLAIDYFNARLDNVNLALSALIASTDFRNKRVILRTVFLDKLSAPEDATILFDGVMDKPSISEKSMSVQVVSRLNLKKKTGRLYQLMCGWIFGGTYCTFDRTSTKVSSTVTSGSTTSIIQDSSRTEATDYFKHGLIEFTSGENNGEKRRVTGFTGSQISVDIVLPYTPGIGDAFDLYQGCDKTLDWCHDKFVNRANFGGFHTLPVEDKENL